MGVSSSARLTLAQEPGAGASLAIESAFAPHLFGAKHAAHSRLGARVAPPKELCARASCLLAALTTNWRNQFRAPSASQKTSPSSASGLVARQAHDWSPACLGRIGLPDDGAGLIGPGAVSFRTWWRPPLVRPARCSGSSSSLEFGNAGKGANYRGRVRSVPAGRRHSRHRPGLSAPIAWFRSIDHTPSRRARWWRRRRRRAGVNCSLSPASGNGARGSFAAPLHQWPAKNNSADNIQLRLRRRRAERADRARNCRIAPEANKMSTCCRRVGAL